MWVFVWVFIQTRVLSSCDCARSKCVTESNIGTVCTSRHESCYFLPLSLFHSPSRCLFSAVRLGGRVIHTKSDMWEMKKISRGGRRVPLHTAPSVKDERARGEEREREDEYQGRLRKNGPWGRGKSGKVECNTGDPRSLSLFFFSFFYFLLLPECFLLTGGPTVTLFSFLLRFTHLTSFLPPCGQLFLLSLSPLFSRWTVLFIHHLPRLSMCKCHLLTYLSAFPVFVLFNIHAGNTLCLCLWKRGKTQVAFTSQCPPHTKLRLWTPSTFNSSWKKKVAVAAATVARRTIEQFTFHFALVSGDCTVSRDKVNLQIRLATFPLVLLLRLSLHTLTRVSGRSLFFLAKWKERKQISLCACMQSPLSHCSFGSSHCVNYVSFTLDLTRDGETLKKYSIQGCNVWAHFSLHHFSRAKRFIIISLANQTNRLPCTTCNVSHVPFLFPFLSLHPFAGTSSSCFSYQR